MAENGKQSTSFELGGRRWRIIASGRLKREVWLDRLLLEAKLRDVELQPGESGEQFVSRLLDACILSGKAFELLGGLLLPQEIPDEAWTPARAAETAAFLENLQGEREKAAFRAMLVTALLGFFVGGLGSAGRSATASHRREREPRSTPQTAAPSC